MQFDYRASMAWQLLVTYLGTNPSLIECKKFAEVICMEIRLKTRRVQLKYRVCLVKWIEDNFAVIQPFVEQRLISVLSDGTTKGNPAIIATVLRQKE